MNSFRQLLGQACIPTAAVIGILLALMIPKPAEAIWHSFYVELWPGGGSQLNCGWHEGACWDDDSQVVSGSALDWGVPHRSHTSLSRPQEAACSRSQVKATRQRPPAHA